MTAVEVHGEHCAVPLYRDAICTCLGQLASATVIIPWRDSPDRRPLLRWTIKRWERLDVEIVIGDAPGGPWCKAEAVAAGLRQTESDIIVVADADVWCDGAAEAIAAVAGGWPWAIPHRDVHRLTPDDTAAVLAGAEPSVSMPVEPNATGMRIPYGGIPGGGITVIPTATYRKVPLDPRFRGWGSEDEAWGLALERTIGKPWRGHGPLWHLWHEPQQRLNRHRGSAASNALLVRYQYAREPHQVRVLVDEIGGAACDGL